MTVHWLRCANWHAIPARLRVPHLEHPSSDPGSPSRGLVRTLPLKREPQR